MSILVTGGAGYIGSHAALAFLDAGEQVVILDNLSTGRRTLAPQKAVFIEGDVGNEALVQDTLRSFKIKSVIHFAASVIVPESLTDPLSYYLNNTAKTRSLLSSCVKTGVQNFVFSSTAAVYGNPQVLPITESACLEPISPYGASKMMSERILQDTARAHGMHYIILRYFNVAGADEQGRSGQSSANATHLIKVATEAATGKRAKIQVFGTDYETPDGTCIRDYIHVSDLAAFHQAALLHLQKGRDGKIFNCGYGKGVSVREVIECVERVSGKRLKIEEAPRRAGDPAKLVADVSAIYKTLNVAPRFNDLETIVAHALAWEKTL
jgi:UDP-glucose 4-epimerase